MKNNYKCLVSLFSLLFCTVMFSQNIVDDCFTSAPTGTEFTSSTDVANVDDSDMLQWTGSTWIGGYSAAGLNIPPVTNQIGCRAVFIGSGTVWTTGGEAFGFRIDTPIVTGNTYSFNITYVSHGLGSDGAFAPIFLTSPTPTLAAAHTVGNLPAVGNTWTMNTYSFVANASQAGDTWIILFSGPNGSSGMVSSFCENCTEAVPQVCSGSVNSPSICGNATATVTATPTPTGNYSFAWTVPSGVTNPGNVGSFPTSVAGTYSVIVTNLDTNCVSTSASGTVTANPIPVVAVNDVSTCSSQANVTATPSLIGNYSYVWTVPQGVPNPGNVSGFSTSVVGTYSATITNLITGCTSASDSGAVVINPLPVVTVNNTSICSGLNANVVATPTVAGNYSYAWTVPAGVQNPGNVASFSTAVAGTYAVVATNIATGCIGAVASGTFSINAIPVVTVNSPTICEGATADLLAAPSPAGNYAFTWTVPAGAQDPGNVANFQTSVAGDYSVIATNITTGCASGSAAANVVSLSSDFTVDESCIANVFTLTIVPAANSFNIDQASFNWQFQNSNVGGNSTFDVAGYINSTPIVEVFPLTFSATVITGDGCQITQNVVIEKIYCDIQKGISPNNDTKNDFFDLSLSGVKMLEIFNRYGTKVYKQSNYTTQWAGQSDNGDELPDGVYYYLIEFASNDPAKTGWIYINREY